MPLPILPAPPSRDDPANFSTRADAFLGALPEWTDAANALEQSLQLVATTGTSTTSLAIGTGSKTLATQAGKAWVVGSYLYLVSAASIANRMVGQVTAYDSGTGVLTVNVSATVGAGTLASWVIGLATSTAAASEISVADAGGRFAASNVETVLSEIFDAIRSASSQVASASGSANALTATFTPTVTALVNGSMFYVRAASANTGAATFQADATTAVAIVKGANAPLVDGDIAGAGHWLHLQYDSTLGKCVLLNPARGVVDIVPAGSRIGFCGETPPAGWLECDGSSLLRASYPTLFAAIGTAYGAADGTHFNLPDYRGMFARGWAHGSTNDPDRSSRTASGAGGATGDHVGTKQASQIESHTHPVYYLGAQSGSGTGGGGLFVSGSPNPTTTSGATGGNQTNPINVTEMFIIKF